MPHWGTFPILIEIYRSPLVYMIIHGYEIHARSMLISFCPDTPRSLFLSHSSIFIPFDIVVIPGWIVSGAWISRVIISEGYISDPLRVPLVLFSGSSGQIRAIIFSVWQSEPSLLFNLAFRAVITSQFGVQSHHRFLVLAFRAITSQFWRSEPSSLFSVLAFRAIIASQFWRSEPSSLFFILAFRAIIAFQFWRSEPSSLFSFGVQSHHYFQFGIQSIITISVWRSEASSLLKLLFSWLKCLESALSSRVTTLGVHIRWLCASCLHGFTFSLGFSSHRYPALVAYSSHSPHRVVPFGRILARTPGWFDRYASLTLIS
ncbi:hypothetical protein CK203_079950 [Vitis vinifera]|uniref:Uncharacterized protein n=1 Tax=Vitis vinifera TaxID=29760 RepID=A0A438E564_VITVI|nr:hypothetical protein CK203_079950 [Vitis vinifera]